MKTFIVFLLTIFFSITLFSSVKIDPDAIIGMWFAKGKSSRTSIIQIYKINNKYQGKILWISNPFDDKGHYQLDINNPNKGDRDKPIIGLVLLKGFEFINNKWSNGRVYDPETGNTYKANIWLSDHGSKLNLRGFIGVSFLGRTEVWQRIN